MTSSSNNVSISPLRGSTDWTNTNSFVDFDLNVAKTSELPLWLISTLKIGDFVPPQFVLSTYSMNSMIDFNSTVSDVLSGNSSSSSSTANCTSFRFVWNSVLIGLLCTIGLVGNAVSMAILQGGRNNCVAVFLLKALSVADSLTLVVSFVVLTVFYGTMPESNPTSLLAARPYFVRFVNPLGYVAQSATVWMTVLLGVNRYLAICRPFYATRLLGINGARIQVASIVLLSIAFNIPRIFQYDIVYEKNSQLSSDLTADNDTSAVDMNRTIPTPAVTSGDELAVVVSQSMTLTLATATVSAGRNIRRRFPTFQLSALGSNVVFEVIYNNALYTSVVLILPLMLLAGVNTKLIIELQKMKRRQRSNSIQCHQRGVRRRDSKMKYSRSRENSMTTLMIAIILILLVCHTPDRVVQLLKYAAVDHSWTRCPHFLFYASNVANFLIVLNSSTNFILYYVFRRRFRQILWSKVRCRRGRNGRDWMALRVDDVASGGTSLFGSRRSSRTTDVDALTDRVLSDSPASPVLLTPLNPQSNGRRSMFIDVPNGVYELEHRR